MGTKGWKKYSVVVVGLGLLFLLFPAPHSWAQKKGYPEKSVKIVTPVAPGGQSDLAVRAYMDVLSKHLGVPVVIVNHPGAGGALGTQEVAKAKPDGYTLLSVPMNTLLIDPVINPNFKISSKDFTPICTVVSSPILGVVTSSSPHKTIEGLLDFAKKNPGKLNGGVPGNGTTGHLAFELVKYYGKVDIVTVPFKGSPQAITALLGNHVDLYFGVLAPLAGHIRAGRVRGLLATSKLKNFPDIPQFSEKGLSEAAMATWVGLVGPKNLAPEVRKKLGDAMQEAMKDPGVIKILENAGFTPFYRGPEAMAKLIDEETAKIEEVVKKAKITKE